MEGSAARIEGYIYSEIKDAFPEISVNEVEDLVEHVWTNHVYARPDFGVEITGDIAQIVRDHYKEMEDA